MADMLRAIFTANLRRKILPGRVTIIKLGESTDETFIAAATEADKVLLYSLGKRIEGVTPSADDAVECSLLNINQTINSLTAGLLKPECNVEYLIIGTSTSLLVYDVENNTDLFYKDIPDGANAVAIGSIGSIDGGNNLAIAGGNSALQALNCNGEDAYWTVTGDNITCVSVFDMDGDGLNELIVGSDDYDIRIFAEDTIICEITETDVVTHLCPIAQGIFAYALANGTVGVYHNKERLWRIKSKHTASSLFLWDVNGDGVPELITGWTSGKVDGRNIETGEVIFKDNFDQPIAAVVAADFNNDGEAKLLIVSVDGHIRGYQFVAGKPINADTSSFDTAQEDEIIRELMKRKQLILRELRSFEESARLYSDKGSSSNMNNLQSKLVSIPATTQMLTKFDLCLETATIKLTLDTCNSTVIRAVAVFSEGIFNGESYVVHPHMNDVCERINVTLAPERDIAYDLHLKAIVGTSEASHFHVYEVTRRLPPFSMYCVVSEGKDDVEIPTSHVKFKLSEKIFRLIQWVNVSFIGIEEHKIDTTDELDLTFYCLRESNYIRLMYRARESEFIIYSHSIALAGDLIQSLVVDYLKLDELSSQAYFPDEIELLKSHVINVEEIQAVRQRLASEIADTSATIRSLVIRSEDARLLNEYDTLRATYSDLQSCTRDLMNSYRVRQSNHNDLVIALKNINTSIQKAANLRVGKSKAQLIASCRTAIKKNNLNSLTKIITQNT